MKRAELRKIPFPKNLQPGEIVWIRKDMGEWTFGFGHEHGPSIKTAGPFEVLKVTDRFNDTPLVHLKHAEYGFEADICASLLSRKPQSRIIGPP